MNNCPNNPYIVLHISLLMWKDAKINKSRKWFQRAIQIEPKLGNTWGTYFAFEIENGTQEMRESLIKNFDKCQPNLGYNWNKIVKRIDLWKASSSQVI